MTTFEEDVVEIYYNLNDFFTIKNIPFSAVETRKGGAGRGEIDILAKKGNKIDAKEFSLVSKEKRPYLMALYAAFAVLLVLFTIRHANEDILLSAIAPF